MCSCNCRVNCTVAAFVAALIAGVVGAFAQISGAIVIGTTFLWAIAGSAAAYLLALVAGAIFNGRTVPCACCNALNATLLGALATILAAGILLLTGITATSVVSALLVGIFLFGATLTATGAVCFVRCITACNG